MQYNILILIISIFILAIFLILLRRFKLKWFENSKSIVEAISPFAVVFTIIYFFIIEYPKLIAEQELQNEQRRLYFLDVLSKDETHNRLREEIFVDLITEYKTKDFSGLTLTNTKEALGTSFNFIRCFKRKNNLIVDGDTIVSIKWNEAQNAYINRIDLSKFSFFNTKLRYANFSATTIRRLDKREDWLLYDEEFAKYRFSVVFDNLIDTDFSFATLNEATFASANLESVIFNNALLENVNFKNSIFSNCDLRGADLTGSNLEEAVFIQTKIDEQTLFTNIRNYDRIKIATPYIVERIKATHIADKQINSWIFDMKFIEDEQTIQKWRLYLKLKEQHSTSYLGYYKTRVKEIYTQTFGDAYDWEKEL